MTVTEIVFCANPQCDLGLNQLPTAGWASVETAKYGRLFVGNQNVDGTQYCDCCAKPIREETERKQREYAEMGKQIAMEKLRKKI